MARPSLGGALGLFPAVVPSVVKITWMPVNLGELGHQPYHCPNVYFKCPMLYVMFDELLNFIMFFSSGSGGGMLLHFISNNQ